MNDGRSREIHKKIDRKIYRNTKWIIIMYVHKLHEEVPSSHNPPFICNIIIIHCIQDVQFCRVLPYSIL